MDAADDDRIEMVRTLLNEGTSSEEIRSQVKKKFGNGIGQGTLTKLRREMGLTGRRTKPKTFKPEVRPSHAEPRRTESVVVTPELASQWLAQNTHNRSVRANVVERYATDMKEGNWRFTHQGISFDWNGVLLDGQHRLLAIIQANVAVEMMVTFNDSPDNLASIDGGLIRQAGDQLSLVDGIISGRRTASVTQMVHLIEGGFVYMGQKLSFDSIRAVYAKHKAGIEWALGTFPSKRFFGQAPLVGAMAFAYARHPANAAVFAKQVIDGENITKKDPAYALRTYVTNTRCSSTVDRKMLAIVTLRTFYAFCHGHQLEVIKPAMLASDSTVVEKTLAYFLKAHQP